MRGSLKRIVVVLILLGVGGCGVSTAPSPQQPVGPPTADVAGLWSGTARATPCDMLAGAARCEAVNRITFSFNQQGSQIVGRYTCAMGNVSCRHGGADESGTVTSGSISGNRLNLSVMIPADVSNCYYSGTATSSTQANGVYMCYQGGMLMEQGVWDVARSAAQMSGENPNGQAAP